VTGPRAGDDARSSWRGFGLGDGGARAMGVRSRFGPAVANESPPEKIPAGRRSSTAPDAPGGQPVPPLPLAVGASSGSAIAAADPGDASDRPEKPGHGTLARFHKGCRCGWCDSVCWERSCRCKTCVQHRASSPYADDAL
jgi:hypothetical protein